MDFLEYIGTEERNLLASIVNFRAEYNLFFNLDRIYQEPLERLSVAEEQELLALLYLFVHFHLYFSVICLLRCHLSESLASTRKAIDAALTAYQIILEPNAANQYVNRDGKFLYLKKNMQEEIKKDISRYPLAQRLFEVHDACSQYGSHADISSFIHRLNRNDAAETEKQEIKLSYFQAPRQKEEFRFYFIVTLQAFFLMFKIFKVFLDSSLKIVDPKWEGVIKSIEPRLEELRRKYHSQIEM